MPRILNYLPVTPITITVQASSRNGGASSPLFSSASPIKSIATQDTATTFVNVEAILNPFESTINQSTTPNATTNTDAKIVTQSDSVEPAQVDQDDLVEDETDHQHQQIPINVVEGALILSTTEPDTRVAIMTSDLNSGVTYQMNESRMDIEMRSSKRSRENRKLSVEIGTLASFSAKNLSWRDYFARLDYSLAQLKYSSDKNQRHFPSEETSDSLQNFIREIRRRLKQIDLDVRNAESTAYSEFEQIFRALQTIADHPCLPCIFEVPILDLYKRTALLLSAIATAKQFGLKELRKSTGNIIDESEKKHRKPSSYGRKARRHSAPSLIKDSEYVSTKATSRKRRLEHSLSESKHAKNVSENKLKTSVSSKGKLKKRNLPPTKSSKKARVIPLTEALAIGKSVTPISKRQSIRRRNFTHALKKVFDATSVSTQDKISSTFSSTKDLYEMTDPFEFV